MLVITRGYYIYPKEHPNVATSYMRDGSTTNQYKSYIMNIPILSMK